MVMPSIDPDTTPLYYLDNFRYLITFVAARYHNLLNAREKLFLTRFSDLPLPAQALYVRLLQRKGPYFRVDKIRYAEIPAIEASLESLCQQSFAITCGLDHTHVQVAMRNKVELLELLPSGQSKPSQLNRSQVVSLIVAGDVEVHRLNIVRLGFLDILDRFNFLFFGNSNQNLNEFVLHEIGVMPYEDYAIDSAKLFRQRSDIDDALCLNKINRLARKLGAEIMEATRKPRKLPAPEAIANPALRATYSLQLGALIDILPARPAAGFLSNQFDRLVLKLAGYCERLDNLPTARRLYELTQLPPAREKLGRLYQKINALDALQQLCVAMLADPKTEAETVFAEKKLIKLASATAADNQLRVQSGRPATLASKSAIKPAVNIETIAFALRDDDSIESQVIDWYGTQNKPAQFVENHLFTGLFGLACWDIIFSPVPGAFFHPFQRGPADLYSGQFRQARRLAFDKRFRELLRQGQLENQISQCFNEKFGRINPFVNWRRIALSDFCRFAEAIDAAALIQVFGRILDDPRHHCSGFPDLLVWHGNQFELVEVKGPGDRLQDHQRRWQQFFLEIGLPAKVLHVASQNDSDESGAAASFRHA
jgi:hypothetical protein